METIIQDEPNYQIIQLGGITHYSDEFRVFLLKLSLDDRKRLVQEIEERNRPRRIIRYKRNWVACEVIDDERALGNPSSKI